MKINKIKTSPFWLKIASIHLVNLTLLLLTLVLLGKLPQKAQIMRQLRNQKIAQEEKTSIEVLEAELLALDPQIEMLEKAFVGDQDFLRFVETMDELKSRGLIADYEPLSGGVVRSKRSSGLPVELTLVGDAGQISQGLSAISEITFLFKPVTFEMQKTEDGNYNLNYGIFVYTYE